MPLKSNLFKGDTALEACLVNDAAHIKQGAQGDYVAKIQTAVSVLNGHCIATGEIATRKYGPSTAASILAYKKKLAIINRNYQTQADDIVGKMTIAALDKGVAEIESKPVSDNENRKFFFSTMHVLFSRHC